MYLHMFEPNNILGPTQRDFAYYPKFILLHYLSFQSCKINMAHTFQQFNSIQSHEIDRSQTKDTEKEKVKKDK